MPMNTNDYMRLRQRRTIASAGKHKYTRRMETSPSQYKREVGHDTEEEDKEKKLVRSGEQE